MSNSSGTTAPQLAFSEKALKFLDAINKFKNINQKILILGEETFKLTLHSVISEDVRKELDLPVAPIVLSDRQKAAVEYATLIGITPEYVQTLYEEYLKSLML